MSSNMPDIPDLPNEVLELIFRAILSKDRPVHPTAQMRSRTPIGELRLVCRRWSNLITDRHLYQALAIDNGTRAMQFINHRKASLRLSMSNIRPKCQVLYVGELWTWGARPEENRTLNSKDDSMVTPTLLEGLVELFHDTIVDLELEFINHFSLPTSTVRAIGRIKTLRTLKLSNEKRCSSGNSPTGDRQISFHHGTDLLYSLLSGAQGLEHLDIGFLNPSYIKDISEHALAPVQVPNITHLVIGNHTPVDFAVSLAMALKPTLTMLSNSNYADNGEDFLRVFEILEDTLQGLFITDPRMLKPISHLRFSSLRLLQLCHWKTCRFDFLDLDVLSYAPIEILALYGYSQEVLNPPFLPFTRLPALRRLVFYGYNSKFPFPKDYLRACQEHQVECLSLRGLSLPDLMVSPQSPVPTHPNNFNNLPRNPSLILTK
ncbi:hypothetical protein MJO28_017271 [Puccinia striiformis f. sp. tritici]|nr:hypothetical protein MJO28_017271 [Puccinia striiformis f. sp. tritici]